MSQYKIIFKAEDFINLKYLTSKEFQVFTVLSFLVNPVVAEHQVSGGLGSPTT